MATSIWVHFGSLAASRHQAVTGTHVDFSLVRFSRIQMRAISLRFHKLLFSYRWWENYFFLNNCYFSPGAIELKFPPARLVSSSWRISLVCFHYSDVIMSPMASHISGVSHVLLSLLFRRKSKKTSKLRVTDLCERNPPVTGRIPSQRASNAWNVSIWWRRHVRLSPGPSIHLDPLVYVTWIS